MAGFTANCPDLMKADDVLVPYFVVHPKCFPHRRTSDEGDSALVLAASATCDAASGSLNSKNSEK